MTIDPVWNVGDRVVGLIKQEGVSPEIEVSQYENHNNCKCPVIGSILR